MSQVWFSIGSNIDKEKNIRFAIYELNNRVSGLKLSAVYQTQAIGFSGNDFYNLIGQFETDLQLVQLRDLFDQIETQSGRVKTEHHFEDRTLDLDILLYDNLVFKDERMSLPHPDILEYEFILMPLSQMLPNYVHPKTGLSLATHWANSPATQRFSEIQLDLS